MSLINDALRRAKQTQPGNSAVTGSPAPMPVAPREATRKCTVLFELTFGGVMLVAAFFVWQWSHGTVVRARTSSSMMLAKVENISPAPVAAAPIATPTPALTPATPAVTPVAQAIAATPIVARPIAPLYVYKLQSVFYQPKNPVAMINGKNVAIGSRLPGARVVAINQNSATILTEAGETKILQLPEY